MHKLPYNLDLENKEILKALNKANNKLGELNGIVKTLPNPNVILNAVTLGEAKESSEIENIVTTFDEIYREIVLKENNLASKEVVNYRQAMLKGCELVKKNGFISANMLVDIHHIIEPEVGGIRKIPGTVIMNTSTGEVLHTPPQNEEEIRDYLSNLEQYINYPEIEDYDPIVKMSLIHYQFESIHPFHDGNGRTGRMLNILYLILENKLDLPILYLSKYINANKNDYYKLLHDIRTNDEHFNDYLMYMIKGVEWTCDFTINFINNFNSCLEKASSLTKEKLPQIYSKELVEYLFHDFYTRNEYLCNHLHITRNTASKYLKLLCNEGILIEEKVGKNKIYKNAYLYSLVDNW